MADVGNVGEHSFLPLAPGTIEAGYRLFGLVVTAGAVWIGLRRRWAETVYGAGVVLVALLVDQCFHWWWDLLPKYLFFLLVGAIAVGFLLGLRAVRARLREVRP